MGHLFSVESKVGHLVSVESKVGYLFVTDILTVLSQEKQDLCDGQTDRQRQLYDRNCMVVLKCEAGVREMECG